MKFMIMHATDARWEAGQTPSRELIANVGALLREMAGQVALHGAEGLRASSLGVRVRLADGRPTVIPGPYAGENELPAGFAVVRVETLDEAIGWATRYAEVKGDLEIDVRPVTEPWDIGMMPKPAGLETTRYMLLRKADRETESGRQTAKQQKALRSLMDDMSAAGVLVTSETLAPSAKGRRYKLSDGRRSVTDGPFTESKELIAGYVIIGVGSLQDAERWALRYRDVVESPTVDVREVEEDGVG
jgi:hypothetical protein